MSDIEEFRKNLIRLKKGGEPFYQEGFGSYHRQILASTQKVLNRTFSTRKDKEKNGHNIYRII